MRNNVVSIEKGKSKQRRFDELIERIDLALLEGRKLIPASKVSKLKNLLIIK